MYACTHFFEIERRVKIFIFLKFFALAKLDKSGGFRPNRAYKRTSVQNVDFILQIKDLVCTQLSYV